MKILNKPQFKPVTFNCTCGCVFEVQYRLEVSVKKRLFATTDKNGDLVDYQISSYVCDCPYCGDICKVDFNKVEVHRVARKTDSKKWRWL